MFVEKRINVSVWDNDVIVDNNSSLSLSDCMEMCWNNYNCGKFRSYKDETGCVLWTVKSSYQENPCSPIAYLLVQRNSYSYPDYDSHNYGEGAKVK
ncbi:hypothetical protein LOK49_LG13G01987 [Camellia lanceoleosa]|uniref:Uncharacterized protein n=1 Tax=Camellia lanceoleosa TaxID=1840588 RepID=A0ACC0FLC0_9ERIC|nr:hypothetical protein LOK49_LG13G01987 [Camellia lanceoleosa]